MGTHFTKKDQFIAYDSTTYNSTTYNSTPIIVPPIIVPPIIVPPKVYIMRLNTCTIITKPYPKQTENYNY